MANTAQFKDESEDELYVGMSEFDSSSEGEDDGVDEESLRTSPSASRPKSQPRPAGFVSGVVLSTPRIVMSSVWQLYDDIKGNDIDLEPDYQRDVVWPASKQSALIASLLSHYYVPPVLLSSKTNEDGSQQFVCVDGKQRLTSIKRFVDNEIPVKDATGKSFYFKSKKGKKGLPDEVAKRFKREAVATVIYENLKDADEREIFQRVQMGTSLAIAEKLAALDTPWSKWFHELSRKYMDPDEDSGGSLGHLLDTSRSKNWRVMAELAFTLHNGNTRSLATGTSLKRFASSQDAPPEALRRKVEKTLRKYVSLANDPRWNHPLLPKEDKKAKGRMLSPVEFSHIGFMISRYPDAEHYHLAQLAGTLREGIHAAYPGHVVWERNAVDWLRNKIESFAGMLGPRQQLEPQDSPQKKHKRPRPTQEEEDDDVQMVEQQAGSSSSAIPQGDRRSSSGRTIRSVARLVDEVAAGSSPAIESGPPTASTAAPLSRQPRVAQQPQQRSIAAPQANASAPARTTTFSSGSNNEAQGPLFRRSPEPSLAAASPVANGGTYLNGNQRLAEQRQQSGGQQQQNGHQQQPVNGAGPPTAVNGTNGYHSPIATFQRATPQNPYI